jgi:Flp pilus assembly protein TadD
MNYLIKNIIFILFCLFALNACKSNAQLMMDEGIQYYEYGQFDNAIREFKRVVHLFSEDISALSQDDIELLSQAHHNLAITYAKKGWDKEAQSEAQKSWDLDPTPKHREVLESINNRFLEK